MATNTPPLPFYIHYLHEPTKQRINNLLARYGYKLPRTYPSETYEIIANRLCRTYSRTSQYTESFIRSWSVNTGPGFIIYAADGESLDIYHGKKRKMCTKDVAEKIIRKGSVLIYYGDVYFQEYESYITKQRQKQLLGRDEFQAIPLLEEQKIKRGTVSPFYDSVRVLKIGNVSQTSRSPGYVQALDSLIPGDCIFNVEGEIALPKDLGMNDQRVVSAIPFRDLPVISSISEIRPDDVLCETPEWLVSPYNKQHVEDVARHFHRTGGKTLRDTHFIKISLKGDRFSYRLITFLSIPKLITFTETDGIPKSIVAILLLTSYADTISLSSDQIERITAIVPIEPVARVPSMALTSAALQLRKTFFWNNEMGLIVVAPKGSMKTTLSEVMSIALPGVVIIDSDCYGKWITLIEQKRPIPPLSQLGRDDYEEVSFFEKIAVNLLKIYGEDYRSALAHFRRTYAHILSHPVHGIAKFQDVIANEFGHTQVLLFLHTTVEANLMSGKWQQIVIRPIHDTAEAVKNRDRALKDANLFLHHAYNAVTPISNRACLNWAEFMILLNPSMLQLMEDKFYEELRKYGKYE
nr:MAG: hypothetical protein [brine shrimp reovirus 1]UNI74240.1 MAG: hypothetical protein [brine shrimp reovirus 1]UNI74252.1 MAG: hypothetical protein [brine shrimp reovirus 1]UNI74264.1 MAG: hypothetical protein [brine shrimp reovirus 1]UNI74276.1 MAG: hypothetical protein [brine shrimp reovirus 1]